MCAGGREKCSFYHFFPSKTDLAIAAVENSWAQVRERVFEPVFSSGDSGLTQLRTLVETVHDFQLRVAAEKGAILGCPYGNLGQEMARQDERIHAVLQGIFDAHCGYVEAALVRAEQAGEIPAGDNHRRACNVFALPGGARLLARVANDTGVFRNVLPAVVAVAAG